MNLSNFQKRNERILQCVELVREGKNRKQMAAALGCTTGTVSTMLRCAHGKGLIEPVILGGAIMGWTPAPAVGLPAAGLDSTNGE